MPIPQKERLVIRAEPDMQDDLEKIGKTFGLTKNQVAKVILKRALDQYKKGEGNLIDAA